MRLAVVSGLTLALAAVANAAVREEPLPAEPLSDDGSARTTLLRGEDIVDLVNEAALARAPSSSAAPSTCASGFRDLAALAAAACPGGTATRTVDWDAYDDAYAAALARLPDEFLRAPRGCTFGCLPLKTTDPSPLERVASVLPWRGKCFLPARGDELVREPTLGDGAPDERPVRLLARVLNRVATPPSAVEPAPREEPRPPIQTRVRVRTHHLSTSRRPSLASRPRRCTWANPRTTARPRSWWIIAGRAISARSGTRCDTSGAGCGWGRRTSRAIPGTSPGPSPPSATSRSVPSWRRWWNERCAI